MTNNPQTKTGAIAALAARPRKPRAAEQLTAAKELTAAANGYRVIADAEGWPISQGKYGRLEHLGAAQLAAFTDRRLIRSFQTTRRSRGHPASDGRHRATGPPDPAGGPRRRQAPPVSPEADGWRRTP